MKFLIKTYGCQMNERDSEAAAALLENAGYERTGNEMDADLVILNTCSVRDQAERKAVGKLGIMKKLLKERPGTRFGLMGCMAQRIGDELLKQIPHLNFVIGTDQIHNIPDAVQRVFAGENKLDMRERPAADSLCADYDRFDENKRKGFSAFISIMRGCDCYCSYCIVPYVRGHERSRDPDSVVAEVKALAERGIKEIMLLGQNVSRYGMGRIAPQPPDDYSPFAELLERIVKIDGIERIRFTSPHPSFVTGRLIETIAREPKICKSIHLPLQSGSDRVLKAMNRPYTAGQFLTIVNRLKTLCPGITFSTDVIVGFPSETEEDFNATRRLMENVGFDNAYIFKYSPRRGTKSAQMEDDVPQDVKEERNRLLLEDLAARQSRANALLVGSEQILMAEGPSKRNPARWQGRTGTFKTCVFTHQPGIEPGSLVRVKIVRATSMTLYGEVLK